MKAPIDVLRGRIQQPGEFGLKLASVRIIVTQTTRGLSPSKPTANQSRRCQQPDRKPHPNTSHLAILTAEDANSKPPTPRAAGRACALRLENSTEAASSDLSVPFHMVTFVDKNVTRAG